MSHVNVQLLYTTSMYMHLFGLSVALFISNGAMSVHNSEDSTFYPSYRRSMRVKLLQEQNTVDSVLMWLLKHSIINSTLQICINYMEGLVWLEYSPSTTFWTNRRALLHVPWNVLLYWGIKLWWCPASLIVGNPSSTEKCFLEVTPHTDSITVLYCKVKILIGWQFGFFFLFLLSCQEFISKQI